LFEKYYTAIQKDQFIVHYNKINGMDSGDYQNNLEQFLSIERASNIEIDIRDEEGDIVYLSKNPQFQPPVISNVMNGNGGMPPENLNGNVPPRKPPMNQLKVEDINDNVRFVWAIDQIFENEFLLLEGQLDNGYRIELKLPILSIKTNIKVANDFLLIIGVIVFLIAVGFAYVVSNHFTKPITELNEVTNRMKKLDFGTECKVLSNDEIGQLAENINEMSIELSTAMNDLNEKNKQLESEINEKNRLDEKRKALLNNVAHELKTPLALMRGYSEGLKLNIAKSKEKSDFYCDVITDETQKMNQLVESLLDINQVEFGDKALNIKSFEINEFITSHFNKYVKIMDEKNISYKVNTIENNMVSADPFMIERVFTNYITNAINYVDENLIVEISVKKIDDKIRVEVFNTCDPINENEMGKLWDSFYKLDEARTRDNGGHGLGLSIVKAIQEAHGNAYGVKNVENGILFSFEMSLDI